MSRDYVIQPYEGDESLQINYEKELNSQQLAAVTAPPGPSLVIAGAGSGKTRTLTYRVAFLIEQGIPPERILLLTFTNKAAREMMRRVGDLLRNELSTLWGGTFHSVGNRVLRTHAESLGFTRDFSIMDREDSKDMINACIAEANIDTKERRFPKADVLTEIFSLAVNTCRSARQVIKDEYDYFSELAGEIEDVEKRFAARKKAANAMDFDDLLVLWLRLLKEHPDIAENYQRRFQFILVDEYQDTNHLQGELIDLLASRHGNVMAVGDDSQSIYSWRGANFENIIKFPDRYPKAKVYRIEINYRSTPEILAVANAAIAANTQQFKKELTPARKPGLKPALVACNEGRQQAAFIGQRILELREEGTNLNEIAVLYRSHFHALELQLELTRRNIPFTITSGIRFFEQAHIKDIAAYLKLVINPLDELAFKRLVRMLPGVGGKAADKLWSEYRSNLPTAVTGPRIATALQKCGSVPKKTSVAWAQFVATIAQLESRDANEPSRLIRLALEGHYEEYLKEEYPNFRTRLEDLQQLESFAIQFKSLEEFLTQLALLTNVEADDHQPSPDEEQVRLSTIHQAKGLEFEIVFVIMLCEGLFPSSRSVENEKAMEEERRLFYVAVTRAKTELYLTWPHLLIRPGGSMDMLQQPSRFLEEIPDELLEPWNLSSSGPYF